MTSKMAPQRDVQWQARHEDHRARLAPAAPEPHPLQTLTTELQKLAEVGVHDRLAAIEAAHRVIRAGRADTDATLVRLWHDHRHDPGVGDLIQRLVDGVIENWSSYDIHYLCQVYPRSAALPFAIDEGEVLDHFGIAADRADGLTDQHWHDYREHAMAEWMKSPDYDLLGGIQAATLAGDDGREVVIACEVRGYSFSGVSFDNANVFATLEEVLLYWCEDDYYVTLE